MSMARPTLAVLAALVATLASGCAATTGLTGLTVREDQVVALVRICEPYTASVVEMWGFGGDSTSDFHAWEMSGSAADVELGSRASIALLIDSESALLTGVPSGGVATNVEFTTNDLRELREGNVLVGGGQGSPTTLTLAEFDEQVDRLCN